MVEESQTVAILTEPNPYTTLLDNDKNTILHYSAARGKDEDFAKNLIKNQRLDLENYLGWTPLMMACKNKHISTVKLLLELGADATKFNKFGMSVFLISIAGGSLEIVKIILQYLLEGGISKRVMQQVLSPISLSILFRHHDIIKFLIEKKFDLNMATPLTGITPLMFASSMEDNETFTLLVKNKADQTLKNHLKQTAQDIETARDRIKKKPQKPKPLKLTPAELISRSPHMAPKYVFSPTPTFFNMNNPFLCITNSPNELCPTSTSFTVITPPNFSPITPITMPHMFFPQDFSPNHLLPLNTALTIPNFYRNGNSLLDMKLSHSQAELILTPTI